MVPWNLLFSLLLFCLLFHSYYQLLYYYYIYFFIIHISLIYLFILPLYLLIYNQLLPLVKATRNLLIVRLGNPFPKFHAHELLSRLTWNTPKGRYLTLSQYLTVGLLDFTWNSHRKTCKQVWGRYKSFLSCISPYLSLGLCLVLNQNLLLSGHAQGVQSVLVPRI